MQLLLPRYSMSQLFRHALKPIPPKNLNQKKRALQIAIKDKYQELESSGFLDENVQQEKYTHPTNYNFETYLKYTKLVQAQKLPQTTQAQKRVAIYDKPKFDISLNDYYVWTSFHNPYYKPSEFSEVVVCKIYLSPKSLIHTFGIGAEPWRNRLATREFDFEDSNFDKFCLYDAKQTTQYWGPNRSDQFYLNQQYLRPIYRRKKWPTFDEFWSQEEKAPFRVNCTRYGDFRKFKAWIQAEIERCSKLPSFEERVIAKHGAPQYYDDYSKTYQCKSGPSVYKYQREYFQEKGQKLDPNNILNVSIQPPEHLGEEYRVQNK